ncbi:LPS export ABC transporter periplasmic protein LptC [Pelagibacteraceae bacterium]|nr:LPS export ABC transporter periplasmic protein LptC [Pelagibacteraceae bacterium]
MNKKVIIQILMIFLIIFISWLFFFKYIKKDSDKVNQDMLKKKINIPKSNSSNFINDINYTSSDLKGNKYQITAEQAEIDIDNTDIMFLENIIAYVFLKDSNSVKITSNFGKYNSKNYDTIFSNNVIITYPNHKITGEYLDFSFINNLGTMSTDIIYSGEKTKLKADRMEIDISSKDTKIFMNDDTKKILIEGTK